MKKITLLTLLLISFISYSLAAENGILQSCVQFTTVEQATALLNVNDIYTDGWSRFDLDSKAQKNNATKEDQFKFMTAELRAWNDKDKKRIIDKLISIDKKIAKNNYKLNLPKEVFLIKSTLKDEGGAEGYTRGDCIVLSEEVLSLPDDEFERIVIHEFFHILTRHDSIFRKDMYNIIGFKLMNEVAYPEKLKDFKLSNPDAPKKDSYITLTKNGKEVECMMILYADREYTGGSFFEYLTIGLLKLKGTDKKEIDYVNGEAVIYTIKEVKGFFEQIGTNTPYIIDPEEALADNFVLAITNKKGMPSQIIIDKIQDRLKQ